MLMRQADFDVATAPYSDDERSVAADSWSVKSEYGSTLDGDDPRHVDAADALAVTARYSLSFRHQSASEYGSDKEEERDHSDSDAEPSVLGLQSHWESTYAEELANFHQHGDTGEVWFGEEVMDTVAAWTAQVCAGTGSGGEGGGGDGGSALGAWSVLDIGTGNGVFLHALAKQGFTDLTGTDYSDGAVELAKAVAEREGVSSATFLVDDVLESKLERKFRLVTDKGTLDAIGLHPDGQAHRALYWKAVCRLLLPGGVLVVTSCNHTKDELVAEVDKFRLDSDADDDHKDGAADKLRSLHYVDHVRSYPTFMFGGREGSRVVTVAFRLEE